MLKSSHYRHHTIQRTWLKSAEIGSTIFKCIKLSGSECNVSSTDTQGSTGYTVTSSQPDLTLEITPVGHTSGPVSYDDMVVTYTQASGSNAGIYEPKLTSYQNFYPYGMVMPGLKLQGAEKYRFAYQGQEKDEETSKEAFQLRMWDARIARWLTTDPKREFVSPYLGMGNNPVTLVDPDGGRTDWYQVDGDGNVSLIKETNDDFDLLFNSDMSESVRINDQSILPQLTQLRPDAIQMDCITGDDLQGHYSISKSGKTAQKTFEFLASHSSVEWTLQGNKTADGNRYLLGTLHENSQSFVAHRFPGFDRTSMMFHIHSHPDATRHDFSISGPDQSYAERTWSVNPTARFYVFAPKMTMKNWNSVYPSRKIDFEPTQYMQIER